MLIDLHITKPDKNSILEHDAVRITPIAPPAFTYGEGCVSTESDRVCGWVLYAGSIEGIKRCAAKTAKDPAARKMRPGQRMTGRGQRNGRLIVPLYRRRGSW
jgi:hypothetical protein